MTLSIDNELPEWSPLARPSGRWTWDRGCLVEEGANYLGHPPPKRTHFLAHFVVSYIYGRQNRARPVRETVQSALSRLAPGRYGLSFGSGQVDFGPRILNLDVGTELVVDILSAGTLEIPLLDSSLYLVISQEVLEHVRHPSAALREFHRVLAPGGELVLQPPFIIGYHPGPKDLWRFSVEAYAQLLPSEDWEISQKRISAGHGTGLHRILTEFCAIHFSLFGNRLYRASKGAFALLFSPLIVFDVLTEYLPEKHRIPGGYIITAKARNADHGESRSNLDPLS